jgi:hypothetical protein
MLDKIEETQFLNGYRCVEEDVYKNAVQHGFWDGERNFGETEFKAVECGMYIARLSIDDTEADWELFIDEDKNISGYELVSFLNQFVADLEAQVYS